LEATSWFGGDLDGHVYRSHAGGGGGFYAEIRIYPELRRGSVVLVNRTGVSDARFLDRVDRHLLTRPGADAPALRCSSWESWPMQRPHASIPDDRGPDGQNAFVGLLPERGVGIAVLVNRDEIDLSPALVYRAFDLCLRVEPRASPVISRPGRKQAH
jgi:hypothetical protein